ncbi:MAG: 2-oxoacid:acceptor oxidoreductase family protein [Candidatus Omnitrophota bacterium]|jgi:2-oxoglutarate ferredoxin oxidoreductase subunit gamma
MTEKIIIAGSGGQGIMLLGKVLAEAAMFEGKFVTWLPAYGAEVRGGTAHCMVIISDEEIGSPYIDKADTLIIMNKPSLNRFSGRLKKGAVMITNSSLVTPEDKRLKAIGYPFTGLAVKLGNVKVANMVALGCYLAHKKTVGISSVLAIIKKMAPAGRSDLVKINQGAVDMGVNLSNG